MAAPPTQTREFSPVLLDIIKTRKVETPAGEQRDLAADINWENAEALYDQIILEKPEHVIEIGMAYGISTLAILSALSANGKGKLTSIDPYIDWPTGMAVAKHQVAKAGFSAIHTHLQELSQIALPELWRQGQSEQFIYIDGYHNVEYVMVDFFFADKLLSPGGIVAFNDCGWRAVFKTLKFLQRHRRYQEVDVLKPTFPSRNLLFSLVKRIQGRSSPDRYFRKSENWEPESGFYRDF